MFYYARYSLLTFDEAVVTVVMVVVVNKKM